jgi:hypothetical protein
LRRFIIAESDADLISHAGLGLIGLALNERANLGADAKAVSPLRSDAMANGDILACYVALLCLGKSDFEAINGFREDAYFALALGLDQVPSDRVHRAARRHHRVGAGDDRQQRSGRRRGAPGAAGASLTCSQPDPSSRAIGPVFDSPGTGA